MIFVHVVCWWKYYLVLFLIVTSFSRSLKNFPHGLRELRHTGRRINFLLSSERSESKVIRHRLSVTLFTREYGIYRLKTLFWLNNCILILIFSVRRFLPAFLKFPGLPSFNPVPHSHPNNKKSEEANLFFVTSTRTTLGEFFYHFSRSEKTDL